MSGFFLKCTLWRLPKVEVCNGRWSAFPLAHSIYIAEKKRTLDKAYKIKMWCYCEYLEEHIENLGNLWEPMGPEKPKKSKSPQKKQPTLLWVHAASSHWLNRISILIFVCQHFQLQLTQWQYGG
jgi:hypothetical protein